MTIIGEAKKYAMIKHLNQRDDSNTFFIFHPMQVAEILTILSPQDENLIAAGWLHDVIEDQGVTYEELEKEFNKDVADLVMEVTKEKLHHKKKTTFPRLKTQRGILLKFADRASNLSRMTSWNEEKKQWYLRTSKFWQS